MISSSPLNAPRSHLHYEDWRPNMSCRLGCGAVESTRFLHKLPGTVDHMLVSVYLAYSMMALLMESVPSFLETWIECLGDLARMAIGEANNRDREIWSGVARMWYSIAR